MFMRWLLFVILLCTISLAGCGTTNSSNDGDDVQYSTAWTTVTVDESGNVGIDPSLALDSNGIPHIGYYDQTNRDLKYARKIGNTWEVVTIDSSGDVGEECGVAIDSNGVPHISYLDVTNQAVKYCYRTSSSWEIEVIRQSDQYRSYFTSLALDSSDNPHIIYKDEATIESSNLLGKTQCTYWNGSTWELETVYQGGIDGYLALDSNNLPHLTFIKDDSIC